MPSSTESSHNLNHCAILAFRFYITALLRVYSRLGDHLNDQLLDEFEKFLLNGAILEAALYDEYLPSERFIDVDDHLD